MRPFFMLLYLDETTQELASEFSRNVSPANLWNLIPLKKKRNELGQRWFIFSIDI